MKRIVALFIFLIFIESLIAQKVKICCDSIHASLRGLSVVDNNVVWVSGSDGTVGRSEDGGETWNWMKVKNFEKADFRDVEAFDKYTAVIMAVASPACILRTTDGGISWNAVYQNNAKEMFLDAMDFYDLKNGVVVGDPVGGRFFIATTIDSGKSWKELDAQRRPLADAGEACFASSGTNVRMLSGSKFVFVSGGSMAHFFGGRDKKNLPLLYGKNSTGANSIAVKGKKIMVSVGGDFLLKNDTTEICAISVDGGRSWHRPSAMPNGYRSCVEYLGNDTFITCGLNGVDISINNAENWKSISREAFHVCRKAKKGKAVFLAGNGRVAKLTD